MENNRIKLWRLCKELNIGVSACVKKLNACGYKYPENPNLRLGMHEIEYIRTSFSKENELNKDSQSQYINRKISELKQLVTDSQSLMQIANETSHEEISLIANVKDYIFSQWNMIAECIVSNKTSKEYTECHDLFLQEMSLLDEYIKNNNGESFATNRNNYSKNSFEKESLIKSSALRNFLTNRGYLYILKARDFNDDISNIERLGTWQYKNRVYIIDTNILLDNPEILNSIVINSNVVIPAIVLSELDNKKNNDDEKVRGNANLAISTIQLLSRCSENIEISIFDPKYLPADLDEKNNDDKILVAAIKENDNGNKAILLTNDICLRLKAQAQNIKAISLYDFYKNNV